MMHGQKNTLLNCFFEVLAVVRKLSCVLIRCFGKIYTVPFISIFIGLRGVIQFRASLYCVFPFSV
jgi:hypothetical protein